MEPLILLYSDYSLPNEKSIVNQNTLNVVSELKKSFCVKVFCLLYRYEKQSHLNPINDIEILDFNDYDNALEVVNKIKPDIIFGGGFPSAFISSSLQIAGKFKNIPVVNVVNLIQFRDKKFSEIGTFFKLFVSSTIPTDTTNSNNHFMRRGLFFISRLKFLLKTQSKCKSKFLFKLNYFYILFLAFFSKKYISFHPLISPDLNFLTGKSHLKYLIDLGFNPSTLIVTGLPSYDSILSAKNPKKMFSEIKKILFISDTLFEHGIWSETKQFTLVKNILNSLTKISPSLDISVKIHPSYSNYDTYKSLIDEIHPSIKLHQKIDLLTLIDQTDLIISFSSISTASINALISKKPIIICNPIPLENDLFLEKKLAIYCKNPERLDNIIKNIHDFLIDDKDIDKFVEDFLFAADGKASYRISQEIIKIIQNKKF